MPRSQVRRFVLVQNGCDLLLLVAFVYVCVCVDTLSRLTTKQKGQATVLATAKPFVVSPSPSFFIFFIFGYICFSLFMMCDF